MKKIFLNLIGLMLMFSYADAAPVVQPQGMQSDAYYMSLLLPLAHKNPHAPFAAMLVDGQTGKIVSEGLNDSASDPVLHGEIEAIQNYAAATQHPDWRHLVLYTTAEPCSMCMSAIIWAGIPKVVYGTSIPYLQQQGWAQINFRAQDIARAAPFYHGVIVGGVLHQQTDLLFGRQTIQ